MNIVAIGKGKSAYFINTVSGINYGNYCPVCNQSMKTSDNYDWTLQNHVKTKKHQMNNENSHKNDIIEYLSKKQNNDEINKIEISVSDNITILIFIIFLISIALKLVEIKVIGITI